MYTCLVGGGGHNGFRCAAFSAKYSSVHCKPSTGAGRRIRNSRSFLALEFRASMDYRILISNKQNKIKLGNHLEKKQLNHKKDCLEHIKQMK